MEEKGGKKKPPFKLKRKKKQCFSVSKIISLQIETILFSQLQKKKKNVRKAHEEKKKKKKG